MNPFGSILAMIGMQGKSLSKYTEGEASRDPVPHRDTCHLLKVLRVTDIFVFISTYLDKKSLRSLCNSTAKLNEEKNLFVYWKCTSIFTNQYLKDAKLRNLLLKKLSCPQRQLALKLIKCPKLSNISVLNNVHTLTIHRCPLVVDVSALGTVHILTIDNCPLVVDVSALGTVHILTIEYCP